MQLTPILGWTATVLFTACYIPQMIKTYRTQKIDGLSFRLLFISFLANIVALWYAFLIKQPPLQFKYALTMVLLIICMVLYLKIYMNRNVSRERQ
ncbi:MAG: PQ-loop repeat-containing protein [Candidatus Omnitrophica bacterium]|nr:PQ-loop repeat-containing protein [Candidatus Omnitrophota bacterium]